MRNLGCWVLVGCLTLSGCEWLKGNRDTTTRPPKDMTGGPPSAEMLVGYLNRQADRLAVIESDDVWVTAFVNNTRLPQLKSIMACEKPKSFRLMGDNIGVTWMDIGSNGNLFWLWGKDGDAPLYYCSYSDFEKGVKLPMPFQPEWVVQALGMAKYDPKTAYKVEAKPGTYELIERTTVQGVPVQKITVFASQNVKDKSQPQVVGHLVKDEQTGKVICQATIKRMNSATVKGGAEVLFPAEVVLEWPTEKMKVDIKIGKATVNQPMAPDLAQRYFTMPTHIKAVDLARLPPPGQPTGRELQQAGGRQ
jgi:hypothetical protein